MSTQHIVFAKAIAIDRYSLKFSANLLGRGGGHRDIYKHLTCLDLFVPQQVSAVQCSAIANKPGLIWAKFGYGVTLLSVCATRFKIKRGIKSVY